MANLFSRFFDSNEKEIKKISPLVLKINSWRKK